MADRNQEYVWTLGSRSMPEIVLAAINAKWIHPSLALRLLKANLGSLKTSCEILEFALRQPLKEKVEPILAARPRLLGLSVSIWNHPATLELLKALNEEWISESKGADFYPWLKPLVVLGGPEVSHLPAAAEIFNYADYVIRGEGEISFRSLCFEVLDDKYLSENKKNGNKTIFINQGDATVKINDLVSPYHLYSEEDIQKKLLYVEASRGCPFKCEFCCAGMPQGLIGPDGIERFHRVREFPLEPFFADMETLIKKGGRTFKFLDRTFNFNIERAQKIMEFFLDRIADREAEKDRSLCVHFEMVPFLFPQTLKELICRFPPGTLRLELGIQTLNQHTRALVQLSGGVDEAFKTLEFLCRETNAIIHTDLIAGLPGEDFASFGEGFDRLWQTMSWSIPDSPDDKLARFEIQLGILKCLSGTPIVRHNETYGMKYSAMPPYEVIETGAIPAAELERIKNFARFWELIVNRNSFPGLLKSLLPPGKPAFERFMKLSESLLEQFGRNWGIDRGEIKSYLENYKASS